MHKFVKYLLICIINFNISVISSVKVCKSWDGYLNPISDSTCHDSLDGDDEFNGIVTRWGYTPEAYKVETKDGYFLSVFHIPTKKPNAPVVFLQHGQFMNSIAFVDRVEKSLAYVLVHNGYDVWLGNFRGTKYSKNHINLKTFQLKYWQFSFHEHGIYDLPAQLELVCNITKQHGHIVYIGFDIGTTAGVVYASELPEKAKSQLKAMVHLSPQVCFKHVRSLIKLQSYFWPIVDYALTRINHGTIQSFLIPRASYICRMGFLNARICDIVFQLYSGLDIEQQDPETLPIIVRQNKDDFPSQLMTHYMQNVKSGAFRKFDYGAKSNMEIYGTAQPPDYDLTKIKIKQHLIVGMNDKLGTVEDAKDLQGMLPNDVRGELYVVENPKFGLADFVQAKDVNTLLHNHILECLKSS